MESTGKIWVEPKPYFSFAPEHSNTPSKWLVIINIFLFSFFLYFTSLRLHPPFFSLSFSFIFSVRFSLPRYVDGQQYMSDVADAILAAKDEIYITDWQ